MWRRSKNLNDPLIQSDEDTEPKSPLVVSHFPYGLLALARVHGIGHCPLASGQWPVTSESNPFHSSEIARPLGNVDSPTDLFLRRVLYNHLLPSVKKKTRVSASFKAMTSRPFEARSDLLLRDSSSLVLVSQCPRGSPSTKYDGQQKW